jgi:tRNA-binding EMAP/Myf-like protein
MTEQTQPADESFANAIQPPKPQKPTIQFEALSALDIRLCRIEKVEDILKNAKKPPGEDNPVKAYKFTLSTGLDTRECVCNLVQYSRDYFLNGLFPFILNLPEADIRGVKSRAMMVAAEDSNGVAVLEPAHNVGPGAVVF